jgi:hypothetical protein
MKTIERAIHLLNQKYLLPIIVIGNNINSKRKSILNTEDGTLFTISNSQYTFKDHNGNFWLTIPKRLIINEKRYYPTLGDNYTCNGINYFFKSEKEIIFIATTYFENFIFTDYRLEKDISWHLFFDDGERYVVPYTCFKSDKYTKIQVTISYN